MIVRAEYDTNTNTLMVGRVEMIDNVRSFAIPLTRIERIKALLRVHRAIMRELRPQ